jgi:hypothetical protein
LILLTLNCSELKIRHDYDREADFSKFKTFDFMSAPADVRDNDSLNKRIYAAVALDLKEKGLTRVVNDADLLIAVHTDVRDQINITRWGYSYAPYYWHGYWGTAGASVSRYEEGTLIIDMVESADMELVWRGMAQAALPYNPDPIRMEQGVKVAIERILDKYPPKKR